MKLRTAILVLPLAITCSIAFAEVTSTTMTNTTTASTVKEANTMMPLSSILQKLEKDGYVCVKKIELEHGAYEAITMNKSNQVFKLKIDPVTAAILKQHEKREHARMMKDFKANMPKVSMAQAAVNIEKAGYTQIKEMKCACHHDYYNAEAKNASGKKVELEVNKTTGIVTVS
jgi:hypothetical protein